MSVKPIETFDVDAYYGDARSDRFIDARDVWELSPEDSVTKPDTLATHAAAMSHIEGLNVQAGLAVAEQYRAIAEVLRDAAADPTPWTGADPTLDPAWEDPRGRSVAAVRRDRVDVAVRAAAADIAVRLRMSESAVRSRAHDVETLRERCPMVWQGFLGADVCEQNARTAAAMARSLPHDAPDIWAAFDEQIAVSATRLTPAKFRTRVRVVRERVHPQSIADRHEAARAAAQGVWLDHELDGMASLIAVVPALAGQAGFDRVDRIARHLHGQEGETRTLRSSGRTCWQTC